MAISQPEKRQVVELMLAGHHWQEATEQVGVSVSESTAYRWVRCWRQEGEAGLGNGRHGHAYKMSPEIRAWLKETCEQGHPLLALTARGDTTHLTQQLPELVSSYRQALGQQPIQQIIVDREGLGAEFLAQLKDDYHMITLLRSNQYTDLSSFTEVGDFVPLRRDEQGQVVSEVAPARFSLALSDAAADPSPLYVALIRDWRRQVPVEPKELGVFKVQIVDAHFRCANLACGRKPCQKKAKDGHDEQRGG